MQLHPHTSTTALHSVCSTSLNSFYKYNLTVGTYLEDIMVQKKRTKRLPAGTVSHCDAHISELQEGLHP